MGEEDFGNSIYYCYECDIQSEDIIDFNARIKNINKYESMMELFNDLKKRNNAENLSDYDFAINIVKSSDFCYDNFEVHLKSYNLNEKYKKEAKNKADYIEYLIDNTYYDDVDIELLNNPEYVYKLWEKEQSNDESIDDSFFDFISPKLRNNKDFWNKMSEENLNILEYVSDELKNNQDFVLECINEQSHQDSFYEHLDEKLKNDKEFIIKMLKKNDQLFTKIDKKFRDDKEIVLAVFKKNNDIKDINIEKSRIVIMVAEPLLPYVSERLRNDRDIIMAAINYSWWEFEFVPEEYKRDKNIIENMLERDVRSFQFVDNTIREDDEYINQLLKQYAIPLEYTNKRIQEQYGKDEEYILELVKNKHIKEDRNEETNYRNNR